MKNDKRKKILKRLLVIAFLIYFIYTLISQQKILNSYASIRSSYNNEIEAAEEENQELKDMKDNINSDEYIEQIAREKLDMYYPNERVYIDVEN